MRVRNKNGFSLVETILAVVLLAMSFLSICYLLSNTTLSNAEIDISTSAVLLAQQKMEEISAKDFDDIASIVQTNFPGNFSRYSSEVTVDYVNSTNLDTSVAGPTDYKRIRVVVTASGWGGRITLSYIKTNLL